jgi:hypothetical protein
MAEENPIAYPPFQHFLISFFPTKRINSIIKFFNPFLDALIGMFIFLLLLINNQSTETAWIGLNLYLFAPLMFSHQSIGPRVNSFTPRVFGEFLFFIVLSLILISTNTFILIIAGVIAGFIFMSSQFSSQVVILAILSSAILGAPIQILTVPIIGLILAAIIGGKSFMTSLNTKLAHYKWLFSQFFSPEEKNIQRTIFLGIKSAIHERSLKKIYLELFLKNPITSFIIKAPLVILFFSEVPFENFGNYAPYVLTPIILYILTSTKFFLFLGESERYIIHFYPMFCFLSAIHMKPAYSYAIIAYGIVFYFFDFFVQKLKKKHSQASAKSDTLIKYLKDIKSKKMVASNPVHMGGWRILSESIHNIVGPVNSVFDTNNFFSSYEYLDEKKLKQSVEFFNLDILFFDKKKVSSLKTIRKNLNNFTETELKEDNNWCWSCWSCHSV